MNGRTSDPPIFPLGNCNCACQTCMSGSCCMWPKAGTWQPTYITTTTLTPTPPALRIEERRNDDGTLDEVLLYVDGRCVFHLEQNSRRSWYFNLYPRADEVEQYSIHSRRRVRIANYTDPKP